MCSKGVHVLVIVVCLSLEPHVCQVASWVHGECLHGRHCPLVASLTLIDAM